MLPDNLVRVPTGLKRYYGNGHLHFITASCYRREPLLGSSPRRDMFLRVLEQVRRRYRFVVVGYVVMAEHFHLLITEPEKGNPSVVIQALKLGVVRRLFFASPKNRARSLSLFAGNAPLRLWQHRFYDFDVWSERKRVEKLRYMHRNPVKRGLVRTPEDWLWSSFRHHLTGEKGPVEVESRWTATEREKKGIHPTVRQTRSQ